MHTYLNQLLSLAISCSIVDHWFQRFTSLVSCLDTQFIVYFCFFFFFRCAVCFADVVCVVGPKYRIVYNVVPLCTYSVVHMCERLQLICPSALGFVYSLGMMLLCGYPLFECDDFARVCEWVCFVSHSRLDFILDYYYCWTLSGYWFGCVCVCGWSVYQFILLCDSQCFGLAAPTTHTHSNISLPFTFTLPPYFIVSFVWLFLGFCCCCVSISLR